MKQKTTTEEVYQNIINYMKMHGYAPSIREIAQISGISSSATAYYHIKKLLKQGKLETDKKIGMARALRAVDLQYTHVESKGVQNEK